ncbi:MAG: YggT family protein [Alphaproteobacteria bacterium]|jgi:YggT family protein|nr:YggT family protein [Alphaproteobacteria bacterium]QQS58382.1 MAG: YggT family protein [Alphaproteobacteria bacterium]
MFALVWVIGTLVQVYIFVIILQVALSWAIAFDLVNANNEAARNLTQLLHKLTDPVYKPIRKYVPPVGGIDLTPLIVIIGIQIIAGLLFKLLIGSFFFF